MRIWNKVDQYVADTSMICQGDRILIGLSGGGDSVCLARYLAYLRDRKRIDLVAVHVNHLLRGEDSQGDQEFVEDFCRRFSIPIELVRVDVARVAAERKMSVEEAGRAVRYENFHRIAIDKRCNKIAVAHHRGDQAETMILNQVRGTGLKGLGGMEPIRGDIIRPFLAVGRQEILDALGEMGQDYREDASNDSLDYQRNLVRHRILPLFKEMNPGVEEHFFALSDRVRELEAFLNPLMEEAFTNLVREIPPDDTCLWGGLLLTNALAQKEAFVQGEVIRRALKQVAGSLKDLGVVHLETIRLLLYNKEGKRNNLPGGLMALRRKDGVVLFQTGEKPSDTNVTGGNNTGGENTFEKDTFYREEIPRLPDEKDPHIHFSGDRIEADLYLISGNDRNRVKTDCEICMDYDKINRNLTFRNRCPGDYFQVDGQGHRKLLKRYFIDSKIPGPERNGCILLTEGSHVVWIGTGRLSEYYKVTDRTKRMLCIHINLK